MEITQGLNVKLYSYQKTRHPWMWAVKVTISGVFLTFGECDRDTAPTLDAYWAHARSYEFIHRSCSVFSEAGVQFELKPRLPWQRGLSCDGGSLTLTCHHSSMQRSECMLIMTEPYKLCLMYKSYMRAT